MGQKTLVGEGDGLTEGFGVGTGVGIGEGIVGFAVGLKDGK